MKCQVDDIRFQISTGLAKKWGNSILSIRKSSKLWSDAMAETEAREPDAVAESLQAVLKQSSSAWQDPDKKVNQGKVRLS